MCCTSAKVTAFSLLRLHLMFLSLIKCKVHVCGRNTCAAVSESLTASMEHFVALFVVLHSHRDHLCKNAMFLCFYQYEGLCLTIFLL